MHHQVGKARASGRPTLQAENVAESSTWLEIEQLGQILGLLWDAPTLCWAEALSEALATTCWALDIPLPLAFVLADAPDP